MAAPGKGDARSALLEVLSKSVVYVPSTDNVSTNRKLWDAYAADFAQEEKPEWLRKMAADVGQDAASGAPLGTEWSSDGDLDAILKKYVYPFINSHSWVLEVGSGGGRVTAHLLPRVASLVCADVSTGMLNHLRARVEREAGRGHDHSADKVKYVFIPEGRDAGMDLTVLDALGQFDFVIIFDVLVHVSAKPMWEYLKRLGGGGQGELHAPPPPLPRWLAPGGHAFLSTSNILAPLGWSRFAAQRTETAGGFCWTSPQFVDALVHKAGLRACVTSWPHGAVDAPLSGSVYEDRDYLLVLAAV